MGCQISYPKDSEWRKWDLHVHTPASYHWRGGNNLRKMNSTEIEMEFEKLYETIINNDVDIFCFMDYWTFEGYIQFKQFISKKELELAKTIFPGMELRIEAPVDYRLNIHVILSDELSTQQLKDFQSKLVVRSINRQISDEAICQFAASLDQSKARLHGFDDPAKLNEEELLLLGAETIEITKESLREAMNSIPSGSGFILLPYDTSDGLKNLDWRTQPHADNYFMQSADLFESRDDETIQLFLGIKTDKNKHFISNFQKTLGGKPKPVICGSDAHRYSEYGKFPGNKITWIKADPTFEGFKQILYEPEQRVRIQENIPEEKTPYLVIDKVRFLDKTATKRFMPSWIELNANLNAIIGGKSSGKSLLLYHIAKAIVPQHVEEKSKDIPGNKYQFGDITQFDFEVLWKDGQLDKISGDVDIKNRRVTYIPQMYINSLAEKQGQNNLKELIESILEQNETYKTFISDIRQQIHESTVLINQNITDLITLREEYKKINCEIKEIGDKKAIEQEINRLSKLITNLTNESGFNEEENSKYERLSKMLSFNEKKKERYSTLIHNITEVKEQVFSFKKDINDLLNAKCEQCYDGFSRGISIRLAHITTNKVGTAVDETLSIIEKLILKVEGKIQIYSSNITTINKELEPYRAKIKNRELLQKFLKSLNEQQTKLNNITKKRMK